MKPFITILLAYSLTHCNAQAPAIFLGDYKLPAILINLKQDEDQMLGKHMLWGWEHLGFSIYYHGHKKSTPIDVIPFFSQTYGTHFGFLTDFGTVTNLDSAAIVCIKPHEDHPVRLVAGNLKDFLRLICATGHAELLDGDYSSYEEMMETRREWEAVPTTDLAGAPLSDDETEMYDERISIRQNGRDTLIKLLRDNYGITPMPDVNGYMQALKTKRMAEITIKTSDGIGIIYGTEKLNIDSFDYSIQDTIVIHQYLESASLPERLKFYREALYHAPSRFRLEADVKKVLAAALRKDGFNREAQVLEKKY